MGNVTNELYSESLVDLVIGKFAGFDIAFNNAGIHGISAAITDIPLENWMHILSTNLTSGFLSAKYQLSVMKNSGGSITFISLFVGHILGMPQMSVYAASKAAIVLFKGYVILMVIGK